MSATSDAFPGSTARSTSRAIAVLLGIAFAATIAAAVVNVMSVKTSHRRLDELQHAVRADAVSGSAPIAQHSVALAEQDAQLQAINLALLLLALGVTTAALALYCRRVATGESWVTVCAWTRRVHWKGRWLTFEDYLAQRFNLRCTHGICDEEAEKLRRS